MTDVFDRLIEELDEPAIEDTATPATPIQPTSPTWAGTPPWRRRVKAVLFGAIVIGAVGLSGMLGWRLHQANATAAAGQAALHAAKSYAVVLTTLDAGNIDSSYTRALDGATGDFKDSYSLGSAQLRQFLIDNKASGNGVVVDAAVKSASTTRVEVLLFVDQSITNAVRSEPRIDRNRIQMTMELIDNHWLASQVELV